MAFYMFELNGVSSRNQGAVITTITTLFPGSSVTKTALGKTHIAGIVTDITEDAALIALNKTLSPLKATAKKMITLAPINI